MYFPRIAHVISHINIFRVQLIGTRGARAEWKVAVSENLLNQVNDAQIRRQAQVAKRKSEPCTQRTCNMRIVYNYKDKTQKYW